MRFHPRTGHILSLRSLGPEGRHAFLLRSHKAGVVTPWGELGSHGHRGQECAPPSPKLAPQPVSPAVRPLSQSTRETAAKHPHLRGARAARMLERVELYTPARGGAAPQRHCRPPAGLRRLAPEALLAAHARCATRRTPEAQTAAKQGVHGWAQRGRDSATWWAGVGGGGVSAVVHGTTSREGWFLLFCI